MQPETRNIREYRVLIKFIVLGFSVIYASYSRLYPEEIPINAESVAQKQPEVSKVLSYHPERDSVKLQLMIEGISKASDNFDLRKEFYLNKVKEFACEHEILKVQLDNAKPIIIDLLATKYENSQFANLRVTSQDCIGGI